jgi:hypothetical protein
MYPRSTGWQTFIEDAFAVIDLGCKEPKANDPTLATWRKKGAYFVQGYTKSKFHVACGKKEFASALLAEIEALLDHVAEQKVQIVQSINNQSSPSWTAVTLYYWTIFNSLALTRLIGRPLVYLYRDDIQQFVKLNNGTASRKPQSSGVFTFNCDLDLDSQTRTALQLCSTNSSNFHEGIWNSVSKYCIDAMPPRTTKLSSETRLLSVLSSFNDVAPFWPSQLRNSVNYRPGFSYVAVHGADELGVHDALNKYSGQPIEHLVTAYENLTSSTRTDAVDKAPRSFCEALVLRSFALDSLVHDLRDEVAGRLNYTGQRKSKRESYLNKHSLMNASKPWPSLGIW